MLPKIGSTTNFMSSLFEVKNNNSNIHRIIFLSIRKGDFI